MCLARLFRLMDLRTRYTHVFSALASGRSASWAKPAATLDTIIFAEIVTASCVLIIIVRKQIKYWPKYQCETLQTADRLHTSAKYYTVVVVLSFFTLSIGYPPFCCCSTQAETLFNKVNREYI